jgi:DNA polymerase
MTKGERPQLDHAGESAAPRTLADLNALIAAAEPLVSGATRAVLGEGPVGAPMALVGEQPGHQEDLQGHPFVGPAGHLLNRALAEAGIDRKHIYLTNAVKHFKFEERGKRRLHKKPSAGEVRHYRWWLKKELELVHPRVVVALGATAVFAITDKRLPIGRCRGPADFDGHVGYITVHPSSLLRIREEEARDRGFKDFVADLQKARALAESAGALKRRTRRAS